VTTTTSTAAFATSRVALRDRPFVDVLDLSFRFVRDGFGPLAKLSLVMLPLPMLATALVGSAAGWAWGWFFAVAIAGFVAAPFTVLLGQFVFERDPSVRTALRRGLAAMPRLFVVNLILGAGIFASFFFFVLPALWVITTTLFVPEALVLERVGLLRSFERSLRLTGRGPGDVVLGGLLRVLIYCVAPMLTDQIGHIVLASVFQITGPENLWDVGGSSLAVIGFWLAVPYVAVLRFLLYINVRTHAEGWDIQTAFATLATREGAEEATA